MRPLVLFYEEKTRLLDPLVQAVSLARLSVCPYGVQGAPSREALLALEALGLLGAAFEPPLGVSLTGKQRPWVFAASEPLEGVRPEAEAQAAGLFDLVYPVRGVLRGQFAFGVALGRALSPYAGARAFWVGRLLPFLAPFLRALGEVSVLAPSYAEGEAFLARLPAKVRGHVALREEEAQALALRADLLLYGGGAFPLRLLLPFHTLFALEEPPEKAKGLAGRMAGAELPFLWAEAVLEALGFGGGR